MGSIVSRWFGSFSGMSKDDRLQIFMMGVVFFFVVAAYTVAREFKDSVFMTIVGRTYIPDAKFASMFVLIPLILLYSKLVDKTRRYQLLCIYSTIYGVLGLVFTYFLGTNIGIVNTVQDPHRIFGWLFYFFIEFETFQHVNNVPCRVMGVKRYRSSPNLFNKCVGLFTRICCRPEKKPILVQSTA